MYCFHMKLILLPCTEKDANVYTCSTVDCLIYSTHTAWAMAVFCHQQCCLHSAEVKCELYPIQRYKLAFDM